ncbi:hypothetical protein TrLO_g1716 [Triparma laevis f. longispina]|uniref:ubiquitinyl hydrolase 1 n=1 Tax=Triparma laevis f. longispina TaxID=1714387 RepID=A0A9W7FRH3_9STRA|nr:hypothetical protein TrLO_g1716 [Triparma laevis f. longispina]
MDASSFVTSATPYLQNLILQAPSSFENHKEESCQTFHKTSLYISLHHPTFGQSYPLNLTPHSGIYAVSTLTRVPNPDYKESDAKTDDLSTLISKSSVSKFQSSWSLGLSVLSSTKTVLSSLSHSEIDELKLQPPEELNHLLSLYEEIKSTTAYTTTSLLPTPTFFGSILTTKHTQIHQNLEYHIPSDPKEWTCMSKSGEYKNDGNLWLNLSDGFLAGGRKNWDGSGGTGGGMEHYEAEKKEGKLKPLSVKITTLNKELKGVDCFSYEEDDMVNVPNLREMLDNLGVDYANLNKTAKTTAELEVELNLSYDFSAITEEGADLVPVKGKGMVGLKNMGNSCYLASVCQMVCSGTIKEVETRYGEVEERKDGALSSDILTQIRKIVNCFNSGYTTAVIDTTPGDDEDPRTVVLPSMLKTSIAGSHTDFSTGQQQDAVEYFRYFLERVSAAETNEVKIKGLFGFETEQRHVCDCDGKVRYVQEDENVLSANVPKEKIVYEEEEREEKKMKVEGEEKKKPTGKLSLYDCLDYLVAPSSNPDKAWEHNGSRGSTTTWGIKTFPKYLALQVGRYEIDEATWQPKKLEVDVDVPETLDLEKYRAQRPSSDVEAPDSAPASAAPAQFVPNEAALQQLMGMGFQRNGCVRALLNTGNTDNAETAMNWVFAHMEDSNFNNSLTPEELTPASATPTSMEIDVDESIVASLAANLGMFTADQIRPVLKHVNNAQDLAADWLFSHMDSLDADIAALANPTPSGDGAVGSDSDVQVSSNGKGSYDLIGFISHIGPNTGSGHYVCHLKKEGKWVIFNDDKVALSVRPPRTKGFLYLFERREGGVDGCTEPNPHRASAREIDKKGWKVPTMFSLFEPSKWLQQKSMDLVIMSPITRNTAVSFEVTKPASFVKENAGLIKFGLLALKAGNVALKITSKVGAGMDLVPDIELDTSGIDLFIEGVNQLSTEFADISGVDVKEKLNSETAAMKEYLTEGGATMDPAEVRSCEEQSDELGIQQLRS